MDDIRLEPLSERHLDGLRDMVSDPVVLRYTRVPEPVPDGFEQKWFAMYAAGRIDGTREAFAALEGDEFLGIGVAPSIDRDGRTVELGYIVAAHARGRGVATATLRSSRGGRSPSWTRCGPSSSSAAPTRLEGRRAALRLHLRGHPAVQVHETGRVGGHHHLVPAGERLSAPP